MKLWYAKSALIMASRRMEKKKNTEVKDETVCSGKNPLRLHQMLSTTRLLPELINNN